MISSKDTNQKQAQFWENVDTKQLNEVSFDASKNKSIFLNSIKKIISESINLNRVDKNDKKYRNIIDLIMLRIKDDLQYLDSSCDIFEPIDNELSSIETSIKEAINKKYNEKYDAISYADFATIISKSIQQNIKNKKTDESESNFEETAYKNALYKENLQKNKKIQQKTYNDNNDKKTNVNSYNAVNLSLANISKIINNVNFQFNQVNQFYAINLEKNNIQFKNYEKNKELKQNSIQDTILKIDNLRHTIKLTSISKENNSVVKKKESFDLIKYSDQTNKNDAKNKKENNVKDKNNKTYIKYANLIKYNSRVFRFLDPMSLAGIIGSIENTNRYNDFIQNNVNKFENHIAKQSIKTNKLLDKVIKLTKFNFFSYLFDKLKDKFLNKFFDPVIKLVKNAAVKMINELMPSFMTKIMSGIQHAIDILNRDVFSRIKNSFESMFRISWKIIKRGISLAWKTFSFTLKGILAGIRLTLRTMQIIAKGLYEVAKLIIKMIYRFMKFISEQLMNALRFIGKILGPIGRAISRSFKNIISKLIEFKSFIKNKFNVIKNFIKNIFKTFKNAIKNFIQNIVKSIKTFIINVIKTINRIIRSFVRKVTQKIMTRIVRSMAKKIAKRKAKSLLMTGATKLLKFFKRWIIKTIAKISAKLATSVAVNAIPFLGQIISAGMILWTIYDIIITFKDVYTLMKDNPVIWDYVKEKVAEWVSKACDFINDICEFGKKLFILIFIEGPKKAAKGISHGVNFLVNPFVSLANERLSAQFAEDLFNLSLRNMRKLRQIPEEERFKIIESKWEKNLNIIEISRMKADRITKEIEKEEKSYWPDNEKINIMIQDRQVIFRGMTNRANEIGLFDFSKETIEFGAKLIQNRKRKLAEQERLRKQLEEHRKHLEIKYTNKRINLEALDEICKEQLNQRKKFIEDVNELKITVTKKSMKYIDFFEKECDINSSNSNSNSDNNSNKNNRRNNRINNNTLIFLR